MKFGVCIPHYRPGAAAEGMLATAAAAERLGWDSIWTTDHVLPELSERASDYAHIYESLTTLAWLGGQTDHVRLGLSVLVVPMRSAVVLAKELATLDALSAGRLIVGVGIGWSREEFSNVGVADRFGHRGAYLEETIAMWRHLWSGAGGPYEGRFDSFGEIRFSPLPPQGADLPIWIGASADVAVARAGRIAQGYQSSRTGPDVMRQRATIIRAAADGAGRPMPVLSSRVIVEFEPSGVAGYTLAGTAAQMLAEVRAFRDAGVTHLVVDFRHTDPVEVVRSMDRFDRDIIGAL